jgi:hypothetical protein
MYQIVHDKPRAEPPVLALHHIPSRNPYLVRTLINTKTTSFLFPEPEELPGPFVVVAGEDVRGERFKSDVEPGLSYYYGVFVEPCLLLGHEPARYASLAELGDLSVSL